ncbi:glycosyl hydrolase [Sphingobium herbicidovorans]|uniref:glycosyl hydrolase n=1 Tax=Sphingobium herbicidovorans TaxID=76947 RepID=UPI001E3A2F85|nr:glycosyl hydrolase [Sphingobium herbicidovorans]
MAWIIAGSGMLAAPASGQMPRQSAEGGQQLHQRQANTPSTAAVAARVPASSSIDPLERGFHAPPDSAKPRVWWHWMNGNVSKDGITKDLAWMKRVGIGGVQNFDAGLTTPQIVDRRLIYMTPEWKDAFRYAVDLAEKSGLEFTIASSPGWSETGGPWVAPEDGMKKLVWSETTLKGGRRFVGKLATPPSQTGPFQAISLARPEASSAAIPTSFYADALVLAFPLDTSAALSRPKRVTAGGMVVDPAALFDADMTTGIDIPKGSASEPAAIVLQYDAPQTIRAVSSLVRSAGFTAVPPQLEASDDGKTWRRVATLTAGSIPSTASFAPVTGRFFRLLFTPSTGSGRLAGFAPAPGFDISGGIEMGGAPQRAGVFDLQLTGEAKVNAFERKAGFGVVDDYFALDKDVGSDSAGIAPTSVINLTTRMGADGKLDWTPPPGRWKVLRLGYSLTGSANSPASPEATGLEVDKYDGTAVRAYLSTYLGMYRDTVGPDLIGKQGVRALLTDSIEAGPSNWTPRITEQFKALRGYDPLPWLPALTGTIIGSRSQSDRFLFDYRRTLGELIASEHYGQIADFAHENGLIVYGESLEGTRHTLGDDIDMRRYADIPMAAFWSYAKGKKPESLYVADVRGAASTANIYGRRLVAAESLTSMFAPWAHSPADLKPVIDAEFIYGVNRPVIHTSVHQPVDDKLPSLSLKIFGQYFNRHDTWAEMARPWMDYMSRSSFMLQQGRNVSDVAYLYGEEAPVGVMNSEKPLADLPVRYGFDFVSANSLLTQFSVDNGLVLTQGGARYKLLYLGGQSDRMSLPVLRKLHDLVRAGATLVGHAPVASLGLAADPAEFDRLVKQMWAGGEQTALGLGRVIASRQPETVLASMGVLPDFDYEKVDPDSELLFRHRSLDDGEVYFVSNRLGPSQNINATFRVAGKAAEIWRADTGTIEPVSYRIDGSRTVVPLNMGSQESFFVVFRKPAAVAQQTIAIPSLTPVHTLNGAWNVAFEKNRGAPPSIRLPALGSLAEQSDAGVRYYSGVSTYTTSFAFPNELKPTAAFTLDLGQVGDVAEVRVNGQLVGTAWKAPYQVKLGHALKRGRNEIEVRVANLWANRLIGDKQPGMKKVTFTTVGTYLRNAPLRPSGLIGPVQLLREDRSRARTH